LLAALAPFWTAKKPGEAFSADAGFKKNFGSKKTPMKRAGQNQFREFGGALYMYFLASDGLGKLGYMSGDHGKGKQVVGPTLINNRTFLIFKKKRSTCVGETFPRKNEWPFRGSRSWL